MRLPVIFICICYVILILTDFLIITDLKSFSAKSAADKKGRFAWWKIYTVFSILVLALLTVAISLPRQSAGSGISAIIWMLYVVISIEIAQVVYALFSIIGFLPLLIRKKRWKLCAWIGLPVALLTFGLMWWGVLVGRYKIAVEEVNIYSSHLPKSFNGYKIAQISDLHVGTWGNDTTFLFRLVEKVNSLHPDIIVFTGDIVNREAEELKPFMNTLSHLSAPDGVFSILGNHDYGDYVMWNSYDDKKANLDSLKSYQKQIGWQLLDNSHKSIRNAQNDSIILIGVGNWGEPPFSQYGKLTAAYPEKQLNDSNFKILLSHNPEHWSREVSKISNIDLTLAGHTHAMQIMFHVGNWKWSPSKYKYSNWGGLYSAENNQGEETKVYVNIGAGEVGIPMRIGADPEITLFTLFSE